MSSVPQLCAPKGMPELIGITGKAGVGKSTLADYLADYYGYNQVALGDPIKRMLDTWLTEETLWEDREWKETPLHYGCSPRRLAQLLGTWGRNLNEDLWLSRAKTLWNATSGAWRPMVVSDVRFENEAQWIRNQGGVLLHVCSRAPSSTPWSDHESEQGVSYITGDATVETSPSVAAFLLAAVERIRFAVSKRKYRLSDATPDEWNAAYKTYAHQSGL